MLCFLVFLVSVWPPSPSDWNSGQGIARFARPDRFPVVAGDVGLDLLFLLGFLALFRIVDEDETAGH